MDFVNIFLGIITSTQDFAKEHMHTFDPQKITCISAEGQTNGRGRFQRKWFSPTGKNIYATFCFTAPYPVKDLSSLAQILALSIVKACKKWEIFPKIKWPNDLLLAGKKIGGVLCETEIQPEKSIITFFLGFGINVNMGKKDFEGIDQPATSLSIETGHTWDKKELLILVQQQFGKDISIFLQEGFAPFHCQLENLLAFKGQTVTIKTGGKVITGICHSIASDGSLNLYLPNNDICTISSGDISFEPPHD